MSRQAPMRILKLAGKTVGGEMGYSNVQGQGRKYR